MRFILGSRQLGMICAGLMFALMSFHPTAFAETRLFVPDFRFGAGSDTQLLISNNDDRETSVDLWVFLNKGRLLGQEQLLIKAHATRSLTLAEAFGSQPSESTGWLVAVSNGDGIQISYNLLGERPESREAEAWPKREITLDIPQGGRHVVRLVNTSSVPNTVTVRRKDQTGGFLGLQELPMGPFQQLELPIEALQDSQHIDVLATSDVLATVGEAASIDRPSVTEAKDEGKGDDGILSLVIERDAPVGAYQVMLRFDPTVIQFSQDDILGGSAAGFNSKPLAVGLDNTWGELRIASFQVGNQPRGSVDVVHIRVRPLQPSRLQFGLNVEEITDLQGHSELNSTASVRLVRLK